MGKKAALADLSAGELEALKKVGPVRRI